MPTVMTCKCGQTLVPVRNIDGRMFLRCPQWRPLTDAAASTDYKWAGHESAEFKYAHFMREQ
jgi:hypothetical protein